MRLSFLVFLLLLGPNLNADIYCNFNQDLPPQRFKVFASPDQAPQPIILMIDMIAASVPANRDFGLEAVLDEGFAASAVIRNTKEGKKRFIVYGEEFFSNIDSSNYRTHWSAIGILAHEMSHHINSHTLEEGSSGQVVRTQEAEADFFAGVTLRRLGANLTDIDILIAPTLNVGPTKRNPGRAERLAIFKRGYQSIKISVPSRDNSSPQSGGDCSDGPSCYELAKRMPFGKEALRIRDKSCNFNYKPGCELFLIR